MITKTAEYQVPYVICPTDVNNSSNANFGNNSSWTPDTKKLASELSKITKYDPDYRFIRVRAIGNLEVDGDNANCDAFPYSEFIDERDGYGYKSFIGKNAFREHQSDDINNSIGYLPEAYLNAFDLRQYAERNWSALDSKERIDILNFDNQKDGSIEVLMAIDASREPVIARKIDKGEPLGVSMGTNITHSTCSVCGNTAYFEPEYCNHIAYGKGATIAVQANQIRDNLNKGLMREEWLPFVLTRVADRKEVVNGSRNKIVLARTFEINYGCSFFELSAVANPAYTRGYQLEKVASRMDYSNINWSNYSNDQLTEIYNFINGVVNGR